MKHIGSYLIEQEFLAEYVLCRAQIFACRLIKKYRKIQLTAREVKLVWHCSSEMISKKLRFIMKKQAGNSCRACRSSLEIGLLDETGMINRLIQRAVAGEVLLTIRVALTNDKCSGLQSLFSAISSIRDRTAKSVNRYPFPARKSRYLPTDAAF